MDQVPPIQPPIAVPPHLQHEPEPEPEMTPLPGIPFPPFVIGFAVITLIAFVLGLTRLSSAISLGVNYEKAQHFIEINQPKRAIEMLQPIVAKYADAKDVKIELAKAYAVDGQIIESAKILETFEGKQVSKEENAELDEVSNILMSKVPKDEAGNQP